MLQHDQILTRICCMRHSKLDARTPGLFKMECKGSGIISLCSKSYCVKTSNGVKFSSKGVNQRGLDKNNLFQLYKTVLVTQRPQIVTNRGMRQWNQNMMINSRKEVLPICIGNKSFRQMELQQIV